MIESITIVFYFSSLASIFYHCDNFSFQMRVFFRLEDFSFKLRIFLLSSEFLVNYSKKALVGHVPCVSCCDQDLRERRTLPSKNF